MSPSAFVSRVLYPAVIPQLLVGLRITLGVAWLVVVAAEMISVNSGLGFLIVDARNAGNRYDLVVAGMVIIGVIGLLLDLGMRSSRANQVVSLEIFGGLVSQSQVVVPGLKSAPKLRAEHLGVVYDRDGQSMPVPSRI